MPCIIRLLRELKALVYRTVSYFTLQIVCNISLDIHPVFIDLESQLRLMTIDYCKPGIKIVDL